MSSYLRPKCGGASIFFTVGLSRRGGSLLVDEVDQLRLAVQQTLVTRPFVIDAWVVLPDHLHAVWTLPDGDIDYSQRWGAIKARFSRSIRRAGFIPPIAPHLPCGGVNPALRKGQVGVWQKRFWEHHIRDEADFSNHVRYCHENPVKHGLVEQAVDWLFSSVHREIAAGRYANAESARKA
jgi:putative transposase